MTGPRESSVKTAYYARWILQATVMACLILTTWVAVAVEIQLETTDPYPATDGDCALIEAIDNANADAAIHADCLAGDGADVIVLAGTVVLDGSELFPASDPIFFDSGDSGLPEVTSDISLKGGGVTRTGVLAFRFFVIQPTGVLRLEDVVISNGLVNGHCSGFSGQSFVGCGGAIIVNRGELYLTRAIFSNNQALESESGNIPNGGGIWISAGTLRVAGSRFTGNAADLGGAISVRFTSATIADSSFEANSATVSGGAVFHSFNGELVISGSSFDSNTVTGPNNAFNGGGAIDNAGSSSQLTVINSHFINNSAPRAGALNNYNASDAQIINSTFIGNDASFGGAIRNEGSGATVNIQSSTIAQNTAFQAAGIMNGGSQTGIANVFDTTITGNIATSDGGGILSTGNLLVENSSLITNSAGEGGGIFVGSATNQVVTVRSSLIQGNSAGFNGGGLYFTENPSTFPNTLTLTDSSFDKNDADEGGGVYAEVVDVSVSGSTFSNNLASNVGFGGGGGIHVRSFVVTGSSVDISNSTFSGNHANQDGGGIYLNGSTIDALISSTTIVDNTANSTGGGDGLHSLTTPASVTVKDTIMAANGNRNCFKTESIGFTDGGTNISTDETCKFTDAGNGTGDGVDPLLNNLDDNGGPTLTHSLDPQSPAIEEGSGDCQLTDQRGATRIEACDIGAFEAGTIPPELSISVDREILVEEEETVATILVTLDNTFGKAQAVNVDVAIRVTGNASGLGIDYKLSDQAGPGDNFPGRVTPLSFDLGPDERLTQEILVAVVDDSLFENPESIVLEFSVNGFAKLVSGSTLTMIIDSDDVNPLPDLIFEDSLEHRP